MLDKKEEITLLIGPDSTRKTSLSKVLVVDIVSLVYHCYIAPRLYVFKVSNSSTWADFF